MLKMENQSEQMKTVVETFFIEEVVDLIYENEKLKEWKELTESLGLKGQKTLAKKEKSPIPFMHMKENISAVFEVLCPRSVEIEKFDITPIPLEILRLVDLSRMEHYFTKIMVRWDDKSPDPVVIGELKLWGKSGRYNYHTKSDAEIALGESLSNWNYETKNYLIGKWGDVKESFDVLVDRAKKRWIKEQRAYYEQQISYSQGEIEKLLSNADQKFDI